ncbi:MAG: adenosylmethionine--8-amino-7-oxononanoate transaminase [Leptospiraceae bacterium]|nr:adenosylmethionine--8-amino-7-oxononanoate transaminase [Leptospiraceae bacterium]
MGEHNTKPTVDSDEQLLKWHRQHAWMPFTQMKLLPDPPLIRRGEGIYLITHDDRKIIDAIGSWWVSIFGHNHPQLKNAVKQQLDELEHVIYAGLSHAPAIRLAQRLSATTGHNLPRLFYSDNGSTAVEIGLKMAYQYYLNSGRPQKQEFVTLGGGYHGDTFGTMSVGARSVFHEAFAPLLFDVHTLPQPKVPFADFDRDYKIKEHIAPVLKAYRSLLESRGDSICALILEPLIQGASAGFNFYPPELLRELYDLSKQYDVLLIADEVFTGSGRTGKFYASEWAGIWPDIMALSKGLSGGTLPFAATLATEKIFQAFYSDDRKTTLFHGHSMTGSPPGCAAALAALNIFETQNILERVGRLESGHRAHQKRITAGPLGARIRESRVLGSVAVLEFNLEGDYTGEFGWRVMQAALSRGALIRPLGTAVYLTPPYIITADQLAQTYEILEESVIEVLKN